MRYFEFFIDEDEVKENKSDKHEAKMNELEMEELERNKTKESKLKKVKASLNDLQLSIIQSTANKPNTNNETQEVTIIENIDKIITDSNNYQEFNNKISNYISNIGIVDRTNLENDLKDFLGGSKSAILGGIIKDRSLDIGLSSFSYLNQQQKDLYLKLYTYCYLKDGIMPNGDYLLWIKYHKIKDTIIKKRYKQDGFCAMRNYNPGNITACVDDNGKPYPKGETGRAKLFVKFPSLAEGREQFLKVINDWKHGESKIYSPDMTILQFFKKYNPSLYVSEANKVAATLNVNTSTKIKNLSTFKFAKAISKVEDGECYKALNDEGFFDEKYYQELYG